MFSHLTEKGLKKNGKALKEGDYFQLYLVCLLTILPVLLALFTSKRMAISPNYIYLFAIVLLMGIRWLVIKKLKWIDPILLLAGLLPVGHIYLKAGFPRGHDTACHLWGLYGFYQSFLDGNLFPLWLPQLGLGMPLLMFYPPFNFYLCLPFLGLGMKIYAAFKSSVVLSLVLSGLSMYWAGMRLFRSKTGAMMAALAYVFAPYHLLDATYRQAMAENNAFIFVPLVFLNMYGLWERFSIINFIGLALTFTGLILTHLLSAYMALFAFAMFFLMQHLFISGINWRGLFKKIVCLSTGVMVALTISGFWLMPVLIEVNQTSIRKSTLESNYLDYSQHGILPWQLYERHLWDRFRISYKENNTCFSARDEMPFYFGLTFLALLVFLPLTFREKRWWPFYITSLILLLFTISPVCKAMTIIPGIRMLQFPWRFLSLATFFASLLVGILALAVKARLANTWKYKAVLIAFMLLMLADFFPYTGASGWMPPYEGTLHLYCPNPASKDYLSHVVINPSKGKTEGVFRVYGLQYPPAFASTRINLFCPIYPEYLNPDIHRFCDWRFYVKPDRTILGFLGVSLMFPHDSPGIPLKARAYGEVVDTANYEPIPEAQIKYQRGSGKISLSVYSEHPGLLLVKEQYFPGWMVQVDGGNFVRARNVEGLLAVSLEKGTHHVTFTFTRRTWDRILGLAISVFGFFIILVLLYRGHAAVANKKEIADQQGREL